MLEAGTLELEMRVLAMYYSKKGNIPFGMCVILAACIRVVTCKKKA